MKKNIICLILVLCCFFILSGCNFKIRNYTIDNYNLSKDKPFNYYYTKELSNNIALEPKYKCTIIETNFYSEKSLSLKDNETIHNFISELKKSNFINKPSDLPSKPAYRMYFTFSKVKYVIDVYNENYISVFPWDGCYSADYIDMNGVHTSNNLYNFSKYLNPKH